MANFTIEGTDLLARKLGELGDSIDQVAPEMLKESAPILSNKIKSNFPSEIAKYVQYQKINNPKKTKNGGWISLINFTGTTKRSKDELRNAELMAYWEYGSSKNRGTAFIRSSIASSASAVQNKMYEIFTRELSK